MRKRWRDVLTLVSLIVCVGSLLLVGRSFVRSDILISPFGPHSVLDGATTVDGKLMLWRLPDDDDVRPPRRYYSAPSAEGFLPRGPHWHPTIGSAWLGMAWGMFDETEVEVLPLWLVPILCAIPPLIWWRKRRRAGGRGFAVNTAATGDDQSMIR